jgi:DNA primase large subunit
MRYIQDSMTREKHLKHGGRLQYGLFLKTIGLPVDQALLFWRREFSILTEDKFQKNYAYNIRFNYGLEGKRVNYTAYR